MTMFSKLTHPWQERPVFWRNLLLGGLLLVAAWLRLWNIPSSLQFLGDQGRDALVVSRIFTEFDPVFIGPVTSVGNMYLGPLYYYFMLPWLMISYPSPVGPAYAVAILSILTVFLTYFWGRKLVGETPALLAAFFMTFSQVVVYYSRFSWNPNPAPLVALGMIYATYLAWKKNSWWWLAVGTAFAILIQLHYMTLISAGGAGLIWLTQLRQVSRAKSDTNDTLVSFFKKTLIAAAIVIISLTPLMLFDWRHNWLNLQGFAGIVFGESDASLAPGGQSWLGSLKETQGRSMHILFEWVIGKTRWLNSFLVLVVYGLLARVLIRRRLLNQTTSGLMVVLSYLAVGVVGTSFYHHSVFDHYIAFLFPVTFLIYGVVLQELMHYSWRKIPIGNLLSLVFMVGFLAYNLPKMPLPNSNWTIFQMQDLAQTIYDRVDPGEKYNIVLMSETGDIDGQNYRYFLSTTDTPPVLTEDRGSVETLFIISENREHRVTDSPIYEIVVFPNKQPSEVYTIPGGPEITVLRVNHAANLES